jgi:hypothetical protein
LIREHSSKQRKRPNMPRVYSHELKVTVTSPRKKKNKAFEQVFDALQLMSDNYGRD